MSKRVVFIALVILAVGLAILGRRYEANFLSDLWSQLFWLTLGTLATTFVVDAILQRAVHVSQRSRDAFAFRSFAANMLHALYEVGAVVQKDEELVEAALSGDAAFAAATARAASFIEESTAFEPAFYRKHYLDMAGGLRDLSKNYIRLFSANSKDMFALYRELNELANHWDYKDELSEGYREYTASLAATDSDRLTREASVQRKMSSARAAMVSTARQLAKLAASTATRKGFYD